MSIFHLSSAFSFNGMSRLLHSPSCIALCVCLFNRCRDPWTFTIQCSPSSRLDSHLAQFRQQNPAASIKSLTLSDPQLVHAVHSHAPVRTTPAMAISKALKRLFGKKGTPCKEQVRSPKEKKWRERFYRFAHYLHPSTRSHSRPCSSRDSIITITTYETSFAEDTASLFREQSASPTPEEIATPCKEPSRPPTPEEAVIPQEEEAELPAKTARLKRTCVVCDTEKHLTRFPGRAKVSSHDHGTNVCRACYVRHLKVEIDSKVRDEVACPECPVRLAYNEVMNMTNAVDFAK